MVKCQDCGKPRAKYGTEFKKPIHCSDHRITGEINVIDKRCEGDNCTAINLTYGFKSDYVKRFCAKHAENHKDKDLIVFLNAKLKCDYTGCNKNVLKNNKYCKDHMSDDRSNSKTCSYENCLKESIYYNKLNRSIIYCGDHKEDDMTNVCQYGKCVTPAVFGFDTDIVPIYCKIHSSDGMKDILSKNCIVGGCSSRAYYAYNYGDRPIFCILHKNYGNRETVNVSAKRCIFEGCNKYPSYAFEGELRKYCKEHANSDMIVVIRELCKDENCKKQPTYGFERNKAIYCSKHALEGMKNVKDKICEYENCEIQPGFGYDIYKPIYCKSHKLDDMIYVNYKKCESDNCSIRACYGFKWGLPLTCKEHSLDMMVDVVNKRCAFDNCDKLPSYGVEWNRPTHCKPHALENMVNVINKRCEFDGCESISPSFGIPGGKPTHCKQHASNKMVDVVHKKCELCEYISVSNNNYNNLCYNCYCFKNPDNSIVRNHRTKENVVFASLKQLLPDVEIIRDSKIAGGCSKRRPDGLINLKTHDIIIEVDEEQHRGYEDICENRRIMEIFLDLTSDHIVIIRFNPDSYVDSNGIKHKSLFKLNGNDGLIISNQESYDLRINALVKAIEYYLKENPSKECTEIRLFYDDSLDTMMSNMKI